MMRAPLLFLLVESILDDLETAILGFRTQLSKSLLEQVECSLSSLWYYR